MDLLHAPDLVRLSEDRGGLRISLFLPTHRGGPQAVMNRIRFKKLLRQAERALRAEGLAVAQIDGVLGPARRLLADRWPWERPRDGLALFAAPEETWHFRIPLRLPELVAVGDRFLVGPLLPLLTTGGHFFVLALSQEEIRLFEGTRFRLDEVPLDGLPLSVWLPMPRPRQVHAFLADRGESGTGVVFHGIGDGAEDRKTRVLQHLHRVDQALREVLQGEQAPLVLADVRSRQALYHEVNTYLHLLTEGIDGAARDMSVELLHRRAWAITEPVLRRQESAAARTYKLLRDTGRSLDNLAEVLAAARQGRLDTLFICADAPSPARASRDH